MNEKAQAMRLADALENWPDIRVDLKASAAELRRLHDELKECQDQRQAAFRRIAELERQLEETLPDQTRYLVGDLTLEQVFKQAGLTNLCDLQAVLDQMEKVLLVSHEAQNQKAATAPQKPLTDEHRQELALTLMAAKLEPSGSVPVHCAAFIALCAAHNIGGGQP